MEGCLTGSHGNRKAAGDRPRRLHTEGEQPMLNLIFPPLIVVTSERREVRITIEKR
jgi:hypothetical protein